MPLKKVKMKIHSQAFLHSACVEVMCAVFVAKQLCNPSLFCFLTRNLFGRKRLPGDYVSIPKKKDKYWLIKSWLHRRRSAHFYTVVHINNNHQDTLQLTLIRLTPKACLRRVSQSVASHQVLTSLRYILLDLLSSFFFFFFFFFLGGGGGGGGDMISPPHKHDIRMHQMAPFFQKNSGGGSLYPPPPPPPPPPPSGRGHPSCTLHLDCFAVSATRLCHVAVPV